MSKPATPARRIDLRRVNEDARRFVYRLATLVRSAEIYDLDNQAVGYSLRVVTAAANRLVTELGQVKVQGAEDTVHVNDYRVRVSKSMNRLISTFNQWLHERGTGGIEVNAETRPEDWRTFLSVIVAAPVHEGEDEAPDASPRLNVQLGDAGVESIRLLGPYALRKARAGGREYGEGESVRLELSRALRVYLRALRAVAALRESGPGERKHLGVHRVLQQLVDLAFEHPRFHAALATWKTDAAFELRHPVNTVILAVAIGQRLGLSRGALLDLALATLMATVSARAETVESWMGRGDAAVLRAAETEVVDAALAALRSGRLDLAGARRLRVAFEHRLGFDASGLPRVLAWEHGQHLFSRIAAVAAVFDLLTTQREGRPGLLPDEALAEMERMAGHELDPALVTTLVNVLGRYPVGTGVLLSTGEMGVVSFTPVDAPPNRPVVRLLVDAQGQALPEPRLVDLRERDPSGRLVRSIVRTVDLSTTGLDVGRTLAL